MSETTEPFDGEVLDVQVPSALAGVRVDRALSMLTGLSRTQARDVVASGALSLDGRTVTKSSHALDEGQRLLAVVPAPPDLAVVAEPAVALKVVLEDADFLVIDKEPGVVVHPGAGQRHGTLVAGVLARYPEVAALGADGLGEPWRPGIVHRLDKGTSGLLVVARSREGLASLSGQMAARSVSRTYLALVEGHLDDDRGVVDAPIGRSTSTPTMMAVRSDGRPARTRYDVVARVDGPPATTLVRLGLETGRTHQIRVHLAAIGHPVVNDARYGHRRDHRLGEDRPFLHASALAFDHPRTRERVEVTSALPDDLAALVPAGVL